MKPQRIDYLDYFRAIAIVQVVILHAGRALFNRGFDTPVPETHPLFALNDVLFHNITLHFALISGIIYSYLFAKRDHFDFLKSRTLNVALPYVIVTAALTALVVFRRYDSLGLSGGLALFLDNVVAGDAWNHLWYIPTILILYALTPTLMTVVANPRGKYAVIVLALLPLVFSRDGTVVSFGTVTHFLGGYVLGLMIGVNTVSIVERARRHMWMLASLFTVSSLVLYWLYINDYNFIGGISLRESIFYVQKLASAGVLLGLLSRLKLPTTSRRNGALKYVASISFGIYFLHAPILRPIVRAVGGQSDGIPPGSILLIYYLIVACAGFVVTWGVIEILKRILGRKSQLIIGA